MKLAFCVRFMFQIVLWFVICLLSLFMVPPLPHPLGAENCCIRVTRFIRGLSHRETALCHASLVKFSSMCVHVCMKLCQRESVKYTSLENRSWDPTDLTLTSGFISN